MISKKGLLVGLGLTAGAAGTSAYTLNGGCFYCKGWGPCEMDEHQDYFWPPNNWHGGIGMHGDCFEWDCGHLHAPYSPETEAAKLVNAAKLALQAGDEEGIVRLLQENEAAQLNAARKALQISDSNGSVVYHTELEQDQFERLAAAAKMDK